MAPTKSGGRVSIRVFPDTSRFRRTLKKELDEVERTTEVKIKVSPEVDRRSIVKMQKQIEAYLADTTFNIQADVEVSRASLNKVRAEIESIRANINVGIRTIAAETTLQALTRDRTVDIMPFLNSAALANVSRRLAGLGGLGVLSDTLADARSFLDNIDRQAVSMGRLSLNIANVASAIGALSAESLVAANDIAGMVGILTLLPAFAIGGGIAITALVVAFKDMKTVLADLGPGFTALQDSMSAAFWEEAADPIREVTNELMPTLLRTLTELSGAQGGFIGDIARAIQENVTPDVLAVMMDRLTAATETARAAVAPLIESFTTLGLFGTSYFDRMAESIVRMSDSFNDFIQAADRNGDLERWTEDSIQAFKDLTTLGIGLVRMITILGEVAEAAGFGGLGSLSDGLNAAADAMNRPEFRNPLETYLRGFREGVTEIARGFEDLGAGLSDFAPTAQAALRSAGSTVRVILGYFSDLLADPFFQDGLTNFFEGLNRGVRNLGPSMDILYKSLGDVLSLLGSVAGELGNLISTFTIEFGPGLDVVARELDGLVEPMSSSIREIIRDLAPAFTTFAEGPLTTAATVLKEDLLPVLEDVGAFVGEGLQPVFEELDAFIGGDLKTVIQDLGGWLEDSDPEEFGDAVRDFFDDVNDFLNGTGENGEGPWSGMEGDWLGFKSGDTNQGMINMLTDLENFNKTVADVLRTGWDKYGAPAWDWLIENQKEKIAGFTEDPEIPGGFLLDWLGRLFEPLGVAIAEQWLSMERAWDIAWNDFLGGFEGMGEDFEYWLNTPLRKMDEYWDRFFDDLFGREGDANLKMVAFPALAATALAPLADTFLTQLPVIQSAWDLMWSTLGTTITTKFTEYGVTVATGMLTLGSNITSNTELIRLSWDLAWATLGTTLQTKFTEYGLAVATGMLNLGTSITTNSALIQTSWDLAWTVIGATLQTKFTEYGLTVATGMLTLSSNITTNAAVIQTAWDLGWTLIGTTLQTKFTEYGVTAASGMLTLGSNISLGTTTIQNTWNIGWGLVGQVLSQKFTEYGLTVATGMLGIQGSVSTGMTLTQSAWQISWSVIGQQTSTAWSTIRLAVQLGTANVSGLVQTMGPVVQGHASRAWGLVSIATSAGWENVKSEVRLGVFATGVVAGTLGQTAVDAVGDLGALLVPAGQALVQGFIDGINTMMTSLELAGGAIAAKIAEYMPHSPAEKGPLSGKGYTSWSGRALVRDLAGGMESQMGLVKAASARVAGAASINAGSLLSPNSAFDSSLEMHQGDNFQFQGPVFGSVDELVDTVRKTRRRKIAVQRVKRLGNS